MSETAIVVGAGIFGVSIANQLAGDGWQVTLVDQDEPGNQRATSSSLSRVIRFGHGADTWYTRLAWRARTLWKQLEEETGTSLLVEAGMVWFVHERQDGGLADHSEAVLRAEGIPVERLAPAEVAALYPSFDAGDLRGSAVAVNGETLHADRVVWACGPWLPRLFPGLVGLRVARCEYYYYQGPPGWTMPPLPIWYDFRGPFYGIFDLDGHGLKIAPDDAEADRDFDPQHGSRELDNRNEASSRAYLARRFPALAGLKQRHRRLPRHRPVVDVRQRLNEPCVQALPKVCAS